MSNSFVKTIRKVGLHLGYRLLSLALNVLGNLFSLLFPSKMATLPPIENKVLVTPALKLSERIKKGQLTSEEVVEAFIGRIKKVNPLIRAVVDERFEEALKEARDIDKRLAAARNGEGDLSILNLPLVGVPVSVKETIAMKGYSYTGGLLARKFVKADRNADAVNLLIKAGLIPIAFTQLPELAMWWDSSNPVYGRANNPYDLSRIPGGSSGGEAALLASAGSVIGIGSDIAGSIRIPANFCMIFGHKPTPFIVSTAGMYPPVKGDREKLLGLGPMTRYACDLKPMLKVLAPTKVNELRLDEAVDLKKLKLFYIDDLGDPLAKRCDSDIQAGIHRAVEHLKQAANVEVQRVKLEEFRYGFLLWSAEANTEPNSVTMATQFMDGKGGEMNPYAELVKKALQMSDHNLNSIIAVLLEKFSPKYGSRGNRLLTKKAAELRKYFNELVGDDGVLLVPSHPEPAPKHFTTPLKIFNVSYTSVTTVLQGAITQCPLGLTNEGLPFGVQILAKAKNDRLTIAVAEELERAFRGWTAPCRVDIRSD